LFKNRNRTHKAIFWTTDVFVLVARTILSLRTAYLQPWFLRLPRDDSDSKLN
jgi:hypothetical protein